MTQHPRRVLLLVAFYLLTSAATTYAECAWVLWQEMTPLGGDSVWRLVGAVPTYADCQSQAAAMRASVKEMRSADRAVR